MGSCLEEEEARDYGEPGETMGKTDGGGFRRMLRKLTSDVDELDAENLSDDSERAGAQRADTCTCGQEVTVLGRLRSVEYGPQDAAASLEAELYDGTEGVTLIWLGRRRIPGIEPGRTMRVRGRIALREGRKVLYNPYYEICQAQ
jgi:hypothetical protein